MATPRPNSRIQVLTEAGDNIVIPVINLDRPDLTHLTVPASAVVPGTGGATSPAIVPTGEAQALSGTGALGAVNTTSYLTTVATTGAATATLAVGAAGIQKRIRMTADVGDCVITVAGTGVTSITLNDVNDVVDLISDGAGWVLMDNQGAVVA
jgi:hypothetical protein